MPIPKKLPAELMLDAYPTISTALPSYLNTIDSESYPPLPPLRSQPSPKHDSVKPKRSRSSSIDEKTHVNLLGPLIAKDFKSASENRSLRKYVEELHLSNSKLPFPWDVQYDSISNLQLPPQKPHSGEFEWIGKDNEALPTYLWDSKYAQTVSATPPILQQGYIAVSWTWGRYQVEKRGEKRTRQSGGTPWEVPYIWYEGWRHDLVHDLKACLKSIGTHRYFWVDVLCINQREESEKNREIGKQAKIFGAAAGVIAYLWTLEKPELLTGPMIGLGHLLSWALDFGDAKSHRDRFLNGHTKGTAGQDDPYVYQFDTLRNDSWFTSLWALQEIVLAPAGVWMTRHGEFCKLNGEILTTRLMAMIIRLLSWAEKRRARLWVRAHRSFRKSQDWTRKEFEGIMAEYRTRENRIINKLNHEFHNHLTSYQNQKQYLPTKRFPPRLSPSSSLISLSSWKSKPSSVVDETGYQGIVVEAKTPPGDPLWVVTRYAEEAILREEIRNWATWAFGTACIDVSLSATRAAILIAGRNRNIVKGNSREEALFAALKVEPNPRFLTPPDAREQEGGHLSPLLINLILKAEGPKLFNVAHGTPRQSTTRSDHNDFDETEWVEPDSKIDYLIVEENPRNSWIQITRKSDLLETNIEYNQRNRAKFVKALSGNGSLLTDMFPDTASRMNPQVLHFASEVDYQWADSENWHMHTGGALHLPEGVCTQRVEKPKSKFIMWFRPNGCEDNGYEIHSKSDLALICQTQKWLIKLLKGPDGQTGIPNFLFLPLGTRRRPCNLQDSSEDCEENTTASFTEEPEVIGVVLVTKARSKKESMTVWHKFGNYVADGTKTGSLDWNDTGAFPHLNWKDGILVSAFSDGPYPKPGSCTEHKEQVEELFQKLKRRTTDDPEFEMIHHHEVVDPRDTFVKIHSPQLSR